MTTESRRRVTTIQLTPRLSSYWLTVIRRTWKGNVVSAFLNPVLYVLAMGVLLGGFIEGDPATLQGASSYLQFIAPGLLAAQAMQGAVGESTYPLMGAVKWHKSFFAMNATPLRAVDIVNANWLFIVARLLLTTVVFAAILAGVGVFSSLGGALLAIGAAILTGVAIAGPVYAFIVGTENEAILTLIFRLAVIPQFLFSGAFFPVSNLNSTMEFIAKLTPLWHGVELTRMFTLGTAESGPALLHLAYLVALALLGWGFAVRRLQRRLAR